MVFLLTHKPVERNQYQFRTNQSQCELSRNILTEQDAGIISLTEFDRF